MNKKLFMGLMAMTVSLPVIVAPVQAQEVKVEVSQDFKDVSKNYSSYKEIMTMREQGIIGGYPDNTFRPSQAISRVHTASLFVRSLDLKPVRAGKEFKDVPKSSPYYNDVQTVYRAGIFDGNPDGTFGVNDNLTRAQMAKVLVTAFALDIQKGYIFNDIGANHWAKDYVSTLYVNGITVGDNGQFKPNESVSRAQYAVFLYRALNPDKAPKPDKPLQPNQPVVKPDSKPETPKPPVTKPNPKPDKPVSGNPFPNPESVKVPSGWSKDTMKKHEATVKETVYKYSPKFGTGLAFGTSAANIESFNDPTYLKGVEFGLNNMGSSVTLDEWVTAANQVIKSGDIYVAPDYSFALYASYENYKGKMYVKINFAQ